MENIELHLEGNRLVIEIDLAQELGQSATGKSIIIATSGGNISVPGTEEIKLGLNVYRPVPVSRLTRRV
jgi:hypothetical protein